MAKERRPQTKPAQDQRIEKGGYAPKAGAGPSDVPKNVLRPKPSPKPKDSSQG